MGNKKLDTSQGHWLLAKMGKRVLRPGGRELTSQLVENLNITSDANIVEFAPGLGFTASIALKYNPKSYKGIELNEEAASILRKRIKGKNREIIVGNASKSTLSDDTSDIVYGEAMLTMQADHKKTEIIKEARRILKKGGLYGIHELGLTPNGLDKETKSEIQLEFSKAIKVNARPLTETEWKNTLEGEGFEIVKVFHNAMSLLEPKRVIQDEGFFRTLKILFNVMTHPGARKRISAMRRVFKRHKYNTNAIAIIAKKL